MKKIKFELSSWENGKKLMENVSNEYDTDIVEMGQNMKIETDEFSLSCHLDERKFSFHILKLHNEDLEDKFNNLINTFTSK